MRGRAGATGAQSNEGRAMDTVRLDPELVALLTDLPVMSLSADVLALIREGTAAMPPPELGDAVERVDHVTRGDHEVVVRISRPRGHEGPLPCVVSMHGGGYMFGSCRQDDLRFDSWAS